MPPISYPSRILSAEDLANDCESHDLRTLARVRRQIEAPDDVLEAFEAKCVQEVADGKAWWTELAHTSSIISARFPALEGWKTDRAGISAPKGRLIDDFSDSFVNSATAIGEPMPVDTLDTLVAVARVAAGNDAGNALLSFRKEDFKRCFQVIAAVLPAFAPSRSFVEKCCRTQLRLAAALLPFRLVRVRVQLAQVRLLHASLASQGVVCRIPTLRR